MRDSQSLLEQLFGIAAGDKKNIEVEDVHAVIGTGKDEKVGELAQALINRDSPAALSALHVCLTQGADPGGVLGATANRTPQLHGCQRRLWTRNIYWEHFIRY